MQTLFPQKRHQNVACCSCDYGVKVSHRLATVEIVGVMSHVHSMEQLIRQSTFGQGHNNPLSANHNCSRSILILSIFFRENKA